MLKAWLNPKLRIGLFLGACNVLWMGAAWAWVDREYWLWIIPFALTVNALLISHDQLVNFRLLAGHPMLGQDPWGVLKIVHELSEEFGLPLPKIYLIPRHSAQIFSYAKTRVQTRIYITQGTVELLNPKQLRAVLTFEMLAMKSSLNILNYWMAALLDICFRIGKALERIFIFVIGISPPFASWIVAPWLWFLQALLLDSRDFYKLDRETAKHHESGEDLAMALWKMDAYAQTRPWNEPWIMAHMCLVSPFAYPRSHRWLRVQPPVKSRIKSLIGRYPL